VNQVDPLGITNLRIRGMWQIDNPRKVFNYLHKTGKNEFEVICIIPTEKYLSFPKESIDKVEKIKISGFSIESIEVKNPNNPLVSSTNFVKMSGVGSPNLKIINNITFLQADSVL
jgi:hypothetical protein